MIQKKERNNWKGWIFAAIFGLSCFTLSVFTLNNPKVLEYPRKVSVEFLQHLQKHEYAEAASLFSEYAEKKMSSDVLKARWEEVLRKHGEIQRWKVHAIGNSPTTAGFRYGVDGGANDKSNYEATVIINLEEMGDCRGKYSSIVTSR
jgi:hypothetical protein